MNTSLIRMPPILRLIFEISKVIMQWVAQSGATVVDAGDWVPVGIDGGHLNE
jgi:hypothetical protein